MEQPEDLAEHCQSCLQLEEGAAVVVGDSCLGDTQVAQTEEAQTTVSRVVDTLLLVVVRNQHHPSVLNHLDKNQDRH